MLRDQIDYFTNGVGATCFGYLRHERGGDLWHRIRPDACLVVAHLLRPIVSLQHAEELDDI